MWWIFPLLIFFAALICEFIDSHLGGGYGTILSPLFLAFGLPRLTVVHSILISQMIAGFEGGALYHEFKKIDLKTSWILGLTAGIGAIIGTLLAVGIPKIYVSLYIGILVTILGIFMILKVKFGNHNKKKSGLLGGIIGFNKAMTGGGFGPIAVGGLSLSGMETKKSLGTTLLAEGITCAISLALYSFFGLHIMLGLLIPLILGSILGCVLGSRRTKKIKNVNKLTKFVGVFMLFLGIFCILKQVIGL